MFDTNSSFLLREIECNDSLTDSLLYETDSFNCRLVQKHQTHSLLQTGLTRAKQIKEHSPCSAFWVTGQSISIFMPDVAWKML